MGDADVVRGVPTMIPISEIFGPTIQGEGLHIGERAIFVRTFGCPTQCGWCDTSYSWNGTIEPTLMDPDEIAARVESLPWCGLVILTGGEPCIHEELGEVIDMLHASGHSVHVETQGEPIPSWLNDADLVVISPKRGFLEMSKIRYMAETAQALAPIHLKIVVGDYDDYNLARCLNREFPEVPMTLQPKWGSDMSLAQLVDMVRNDINWSVSVRVLPQLHRLLWGDARGV